MDESLSIGNRAIYCLAGPSIASLFIFLIEKKNGGFALCRADIIDRIVTSEDWHPTLEEAKAQAGRETRQEKFNWKSIPGNTADPIEYIFEHEPRLTVKIDLSGKSPKNAVDLVIYLVWADFALTSLLSLLEYMNQTSEIPEGLESILPDFSPGLVSLVFFALNFAFTLAMAVKLAEGANWARKTFLFSCAFTLVPLIVRPGALAAHFWSVGLLSLLQAGVEIYALFKLYTGEGHKKFRKR